MNFTYTYYRLCTTESSGPLEIVIFNGLPTVYDINIALQSEYMPGMFGDNAKSAIAALNNGPDSDGTIFLGIVRGQHDTYDYYLEEVRVVDLTQ